MLLRQFCSTRVIFSIRVIFNTFVLGCVFIVFSHPPDAHGIKAACGVEPLRPYLFADKELSHTSKQWVCLHSSKRIDPATKQRIRNMKVEDFAEYVNKVALPKYLEEVTSGAQRKCTSSAHASAMRGRVGITFQGQRREFEPHNRGILQFCFQRKRSNIGSKIFAIPTMGAAAA